MPGQARRHLFLLLIAVAAGVLALTASSATANTVLVGAPGGGSGGGGWLNSNSTPATVVNTSLGEPGAHVTSPVTGTIVGWQLTTLGAGAYRLHVLRPSSSGQYTEEGSTPGDVTVSGSNAFSASLPIQAGDVIGLDVPAAQGIDGHVGIPGSAWALFSPALTGGATAGPSDSSSSDRELLFNAQVEYAPTPDTSPPSGGSHGGCRKAKEQKRKEKKHGRAASASKKCGKKKRK
jgi:hypothetical protein